MCHLVQHGVVPGHLVQGEAGEARRQQGGQVHDIDGAWPPWFCPCKICPTFWAVWADGGGVGGLGIRVTGRHHAEWKLHYMWSSISEYWFSSRHGWSLFKLLYYKHYYYSLEQSNSAIILHSTSQSTEDEMSNINYATLVVNMYC